MSSFDLKPKVKYLILDKPTQWDQWKAQLDMILMKNGRLQLIESAKPPEDYYETVRETFTQEDRGAASETIYHTISRRLQQELLHFMKEPYDFFKALKNQIQDQYSRWDWPFEEGALGQDSEEQRNSRSFYR